MRLLLVLSLVLTTSLAHAQTPQTAPPPRLVSALSLIDAPAPALFLVTPKGVRTPFAVGAGSRGAANPVPASPTLRLYRETKSPEGESALSLAFETPLPPGNAPLLLAFFRDPSGRATARILTDDPTGHAAGTVRLVNLSASEVLCKIDDKIVPVPAQDTTGVRVKVADTFRFLFTYGARQPDGDILHVPAKRLRLPSTDMRLLVLFATQYENRAEGRVLVVRDARVYDRVAAPEETPRLAKN